MDEAADGGDGRVVICDYQAQGAGRGLRSFKDNHRSYDPLCYPLLFPYGTDGFHLKIPYTSHSQAQQVRDNQEEMDSTQHDNLADSRTSTTRFVSAREFYAYRMMERSAFSMLHRSGRLFQQYIVDMWAKVETSRLTYIKTHQVGAYNS